MKEDQYLLHNLNLINNRIQNACKSVDVIPIRYDYCWLRKRLLPKE
jgi:hypothetical protein